VRAELKDRGYRLSSGPKRWRDILTESSEKRDRESKSVRDEMTADERA